ncbi:MAG TPA: protein kinase [Anaerolineae bacterium]|nr:protein kinase [Anaerolineae bacterium]
MDLITPDGQVTLNNRYQLIDRVGSGGMALVYKAQDLLLGRMVAIKVLQANLTDDTAFLNRFRQEAAAAANLAHPNIVTVHDIGQDENLHYIVMEFVDGPTLKQIIRHQNKHGRTISIPRALDLAIQICNGIGYAHRAHLIHCDVKPQNMLVTRDERVKVADFGIARAISTSYDQQPEVVWGTPQYFSPEQAMGKAATPASDVYSIGVILFEMLTGQLPFQAETPTLIAQHHVYTPAPVVTDFNPEVPEPLAQILTKVLDKQPNGRYGTADQLGRVLNSYYQTITHGTHPRPPIPVINQDPISISLPRPTKTPTSQPSLPTPDTEDTPSLPAEPIPAPTSVTLPPPSHAPKRATPTASEAPTIVQVTPQPNHIPAEDPSFDTLAVFLAITALATVLGLIPTWYWVYLHWVAVIN